MKDDSTIVVATTDLPANLAKFGETKGKQVLDLAQMYKIDNTIVVALVDKGFDVDDIGVGLDILDHHTLPQQVSEVLLGEVSLLVTAVGTPHREALGEVPEGYAVIFGQRRSWDDIRAEDERQAIATALGQPVTDQRVEAFSYTEATETRSKVVSDLIDITVNELNCSIEEATSVVIKCVVDHFDGNILKAYHHSNVKEDEFRRLLGNRQGREDRLLEESDDEAFHSLEDEAERESCEMEDEEE